MRRPLRALRAILPALLPAPLCAQSHLFTFDGPKVSEKSGSAVASAGDVDKDGHDDVIAGAPEGSTNGFRSGTARVYSGATGLVIHEIHGDFAGDLFGNAVAGVGDTDGDGYGDFVVGARLDDNKGPDSGSARLFSGRTGRPIRTWDGDSFGDQLGLSVAGAGDVNRDGTPDVIVGAPHDDKNARADSGTAFVFDGKTGAKLHEWSGANQFDNFGWSVAGAGNVDADGHDDVIIGTRQLLNGSVGYAQVRSGKTGAVLHNLKGTVQLAFFGYSVGGAGDQTNDGSAEVIVGSYRETRNGRNSGAARVFDGKAGNVRHVFLGDGPDDELGTSVAGAGDFDGDKVPDVIVGIPGDDNRGVNSGAARVFSGANGKLLKQFDGPAPLVRLGQAVAGGALANLDDLADVIVGSPHDNTGGGLAGRAQVFTFGVQLEGDRHLVSLAKNQSQKLVLRTGSGNAGKAYFLLGALGIRPGIDLGSVKLPLNLDPYLQITVSFPNSPLLMKSLGTLDSGGNAFASFHAIPQIPPGLIGTSFWHAFVVIGRGFEIASVPVPVTLIK